MACAAILVAAGGGGLAAGFTVRPSLAPDAPVAVAEMSPSETVSLRFPADWAEPESEMAPRTLAFASADGTLTLFSPRPIYPIAETQGDTRTLGAAGPMLASADSRAVSFSDVPATPKVVAAAVTPKVAMASTTPTPKPARATRSNAVLSDAQIASVKRRLNLTPDQERYWPAVEAELRKMQYKKDKSAPGSRMAAIDMSRVDVDGLKSAGFPLVMSFNEDQRRELRSLAHLLGLEKVMSGI
jgi:hypothetical protein